MHPIISVIMPVYNAEPYLEESLSGVLNQTIQQLELICVDDGSTDSSVSILEKFASSDERIRILKQDHKGAGAARNYGFSQASGEYVIFLDSDDLFAPDLLEKSYFTAIEKDADIVAFDYLKLYPDGTSDNQNGFRRDLADEIPVIFNYRDYPDMIMSSVHPVPWNKLYKADFIRKHHLKFEELFSTDDITFAGVSLAYAQRIAFLEERLVQYRVGRSGSVTSQKSKT